jgi:hypothetical protein
MNLHRSTGRRHVHSRQAVGGIALLETLVYVGVFFLVAGLAFSVFYRTEEQSRSLRRSADDIAASLSAGERWRADIRAASTPPVMAREALTIRHAAGEVHYFVRSNAVWRQVNDAEPLRVVDGVEAASFESDRREFAAAWRWNLELKRRRHSSRLRPMFTFSAVPQTKGAP